VWSAGAKAHDLYLGTRAFAVCHRRERVLARPVVGFEAALAAMREWLDETPTRLTLRIWLSGGLSRSFVVQPVPGVQTEEELRRVAVTLASRLTGQLGACKVWMDHGKLEQPRVAVAVQRSDLDKLEEVVKVFGRRHRITSIRPWWSEVLRTALRRQPHAAAVATQDCDSLTVLVGQGETFEVATTLTPVIDCETADSALARLLLSADVPEGRAVVGRLMLNRESDQEGDVTAALSALMEFDR
jgi:hypothetical protein